MSDDDKAEGEGFVIKDSRSSQLSEEEAESHDPQGSAPPTETGQENQNRHNKNRTTPINHLHYRQRLSTQKNERPKKNENNKTVQRKPQQQQAMTARTKEWWFWKQDDMASS